MLNQAPEKMLNNKVISRIPTTRPATTFKPPPSPPPPPPPSLTSSDIGKPIITADSKSGILRYIGKTDFAAGVWCGIELPEPNGKHNGTVQSKRYFTCPPHCGLMVPLAKCYPLPPSDTASGPYSILFLTDNDDHNATIIENRATFCLTDSKKRKLDDNTVVVAKPRLSLDFNTNLVASTPHRVEFDENRTRKVAAFDDDAANKRDSLEYDESLGILTPSQMIDGAFMFPPSTSASSKSVCLKKQELSSPGVTEFSLGIIDDHIISNLTTYTDPINMELALDPNATIRLEQTPSPEELPLDPTPKSANLITSITSLDTGYQGDGEMSRPASRGADNSPLRRAPTVRRTDPMTDSDFYTESDHDENPKGDRKAQVIDGVMYGVDAQAAADIYANNRENMDSSGVFTDLETVNETVDVSPTSSDSSSKTLSGDSQGHVLVSAMVEKEANEAGKKRMASSPIVASPMNARGGGGGGGGKKVKMPKREVESKVKAMLEKQVEENKGKGASGGKKLGRWDAVMSKITKNENCGKLPNLENVKSKVFDGVKRGGERVVVTEKVGGSRLLSSQKTPNNKVRRVRSRVTNNSNSSPKSNVGSSIHSSVSDLSAAGFLPKPNFGASKKVVQATHHQVLTPSKLTPRPTPPNSAESKKTPNSATKKRLPLVPNKKKTPTNNNKDCGRATTIPRPPTRPPSKPAPNVAEALAVLVQHLVFNVEAYKVPQLKKEVQKQRNEIDEIRNAYQILEDSLEQERNVKLKEIEDERAHFAAQVRDLARERQKSAQLEVELERLLSENTTSKETLSKHHEDNLTKLKSEFTKLQKNYEESLDILREENDGIREQIDEKNAQIDALCTKYTKLCTDHETKEHKLKELLHALKTENANLKHDYHLIEQKLEAEKDEKDRIRDENDRILSYDNKSTGLSIQEVQSLRVVLELKQNQVFELRRALTESTQKNEILAGAEERAAALTARCEDLELQLERKNEIEQTLVAENKKLSDSFKEESNQKKRICQHNEELQWKLQQNKEVFNKVIEKAVEEKNFMRTNSFREHSKTIDDALESEPTSPKVKGIVKKSDWVSYELDMNESPEAIASRIVRRSFRAKTTPTKSPCNNKRARVKNALSLSASESEITRGKGGGEYGRSQSLSNRNEIDDYEGLCWYTSTPKKELDLEDEEDEDLLMQLPALPSELGRGGGAEALPSPKHLAGEAMVSESNSDDESTSSSSVQL